MRPLAVAVLFLLAPAAFAADARETEAFVVSYRCEDGEAIAVGYPAYRDAATEPIRLAWHGRRYVLHPARSGSGARYLTRDGRLQWWSKGDEGTLAVPGATTILENCRAF
jgi:membrane-bound inhibitor of C-type lysozyme